jgi:acyl dehydratase
MTGRMLTDFVGDGRLTRFGVRFVRQVWPGDALTATVTVEAVHDADGTRLVDLAVSTRNQDGEEVVSGYATAEVD